MDVVGFLVAAFEIPVVALDCGYAAVPVVGRCGNRMQPLPCAANDGLAAFFAGDGTVSAWVAVIWAYLIIESEKAEDIESFGHNAV